MLTRFLHFIANFIVEFLIVLFVYCVVSYCQKKFSKKSKGKFSIKETINEGWGICLVIALVITLTNQMF